MKERLKEMLNRLGEQKSTLKERIDGIEREIRDTKRSMKIIEKYSESPPKGMEEISELFSVLCYNDWAFCCRPSMKPCLLRDSVLEIMEIKPKEFEKKKIEMGLDLVRNL